MTWTYQLEADVEGGPWERVRVWLSNEQSPSSVEPFAMHEPVLLDEPPTLWAADDVWWIEALREEHVGTIRNVVRLRSTSTLRPTTAYHETGPENLRKMPAMLRIAVEASDL